MPNYIAYMKQTHESCDYSIGCGYFIVEFEAENMLAAKNVAIEKLNLDDYRNGEADPAFYIDGGRALETFKILEISIDENMMHELFRWKSQFDLAREEVKEKEQKAREIQELRRLQQKYPNGR